MKAAVANVAGPVLAVAIAVVGLGTIAVAAGFDPAPLVELVTRLAN